MKPFINNYKTINTMLFKMSLDVVTPQDAKHPNVPKAHQQINPFNILPWKIAQNRKSFA